MNVTVGKSAGAPLLLDVHELGVAFQGEMHIVEVVRGISFAMRPAERAALVGESGCGKSMTCLAVTRLPPTDRARVGGRVLFGGSDLLAGSVGGAGARDGRIAYVFQDPSASLNPVMRVGAQLAEALHPTGDWRHPRRWRERRDDHARAQALLERVRLPDAAALLRAYPCELSGGMQQRVMLAMALARGPQLLIADEPTTALDVTTQAEVLDLVDDLVKEMGMALLLVTHNLGLVAGRCDTMHVIYAGQIVESGPVAQVLHSPAHPYTLGLLRAVPRLGAARHNTLRDIPGTVPQPDRLPPGCAFSPRCPLRDAVCGAPPPVRSVGERRECRCFHPHSARPPQLGSGAGGSGCNAADGLANSPADNRTAAETLAAENITVTFRRRGGGVFKALDGVSLSLPPGGAVGLIGGSGSGKSTLSRVLAGLLKPDSGRVLLDGVPLPGQRARNMRDTRVQMIFQDAAGALNPRQTVHDALAEALTVTGGVRCVRAELTARIRGILAQTGLAGDVAARYPRELSGGQCQRVCIARALAVEPRILIADEPVSALDVSVQARILKLLDHLRRERGLSLLLVAHDLAVVGAICDHALVLQEGRVVEEGPPARLFSRPAHPYTRRLLAAVFPLDGKPKPHYNKRVASSDEINNTTTIAGE